jgi:undecaprenyl-diphosphatase
MEWYEALILGVIQGLTEFLPVSSSGHLEIGSVLLGSEPETSLDFTVAVHGATVLSTLVVFRKDILHLLQNGLRLQYNESTAYILKILLSMVPVLVVGLFFKENVEALFTGNLALVGSMLLVTSALLGFTYLRKKHGTVKLGYLQAFIIGISQAVAVIPGISRSGATIATGLMLGNRRDEIARFSFLMVIIPIIGANLMDIAGNTAKSSTPLLPLLIGFSAAFLSGLIACRWMIKLVNRGKLAYFAAYCAILGICAVIFA